ncbi:rhomboid family intramembrane serine protease [Priestia megaterium]|nr:rhomboid family intramembrane serine protease [Priestia megaterium]
MKQDYYFWSFIQQLLLSPATELIYTNANASELWFEVKKPKEKYTMRVIRKHFNWMIDLQKDRKLAIQRAEQIRRQRFQRRLHLNNVYIMDFKPINNGMLMEEATVSSKVSGETTIISENDSIKYEQLFTRLDFRYPDIENLSDEEIFEQIERLKRQSATIIQGQKKEEEAIFQYGKPFFTYIFLAVQIAMFLFLEWKGGSEDTLTLLEYGAKYNPLILAGEWWRFFTPIVLHIGFLHLLMNSFALYYLGSLVEQIYGNMRFLFIYIVAGFAGTLGSFVWTSSLSAGASGAIFGCFGALLFLARTHPKLFFRTIGYNIIAIIVINLVFGFVVPGIDNAGHVGGLVGGFLAASIVSLPKQRRLYMQIPALISTVLLVGGLLYYGFFERSIDQDEPYALSVAGSYIQEKQYEKARSLLEIFIDKETQNSRVYYAAAYAEAQLNEYEHAEELMKKAVQYEPKFHEGFYYLSLLNVQLNDVEEAKENVEKARELDPNNQDYEKLWQELHD